MAQHQPGSHVGNFRDEIFVTPESDCVQEERHQKAAQKKGFDTKSLHKTQNLLMVRTR
jgi:hypothetical protein